MAQFLSATHLCISGPLWNTLPSFLLSWTLPADQLDLQQRQTPGQGARSSPVLYEGLTGAPRLLNNRREGLVTGLGPGTTSISVKMALGRKGRSAQAAGGWSGWAIFPYSLHWQVTLLPFSSTVNLVCSKKSSKQGAIQGKGRRAVVGRAECRVAPSPASVFLIFFQVYSLED